MLKTRVLTAMTLAPLVLAVSWWGNALVFSLFTAALMALVVHEWLAIVHQHKGLSQWLMPLIVAAIIIGHGLNGTIAVHVIVYLAVALWALALGWLAKPQWGYGNGLIASKVKAYLGIFLGLTAGLALVSLHNHQVNGRLWTLILFGLIWVADIGAYFSGRLWGRHKLAPAISPGKTIEGVIGALLLVSIYAAIVAYTLDYSVLELVAGFAAIALISVVGDLTASLVKRQGQVKDSGRWLPGHGGFLDRFDSLLAAAPFFLAFVYWLSTRG